METRKVVLLLNQRKCRFIGLRFGCLGDGKVRSSVSLPLFIKMGDKASKLPA